MIFASPTPDGWPPCFRSTLKVLSKKRIGILSARGTSRIRRFPVCVTPKFAIQSVYFAAMMPSALHTLYENGNTSLAIAPNTVNVNGLIRRETVTVRLTDIR